MTAAYDGCVHTAHGSVIHSKCDAMRFESAEQCCPFFRSKCYAIQCNSIDVYDTWCHCYCLTLRLHSIGRFFHQKLTIWCFTIHGECQIDCVCFKLLQQNIDRFFTPFRKQTNSPFTQNHAIPSFVHQKKIIPKSQIKPNVISPLERLDLVFNVEIEFNISYCLEFFFVPLSFTSSMGRF